MAEQLSDEAICRRAFEGALISGAPVADAAWLAIREIEDLARERVRRQLDLPRPKGKEPRERALNLGGYG